MASATDAVVEEMEKFEASDAIGAGKTMMRAIGMMVQFQRLIQNLAWDKLYHSTMQKYYHKRARREAQ